MYTDHNFRSFLDKKVDEYDQPSFISADPVFIPHLFTKKQDILLQADRKRPAQVIFNKFSLLTFVKIAENIQMVIGQHIHWRYRSKLNG